MSAKEKRGFVKKEGWNEETTHVGAGTKSKIQVCVCVCTCARACVCACVWCMCVVAGNNAGEGLRRDFCKLFHLLNFGSPMLLLDGVSLCFWSLGNL